MKRERIDTIHGIGVYFERDLPRIADARGFWPFRKFIVVGLAWIRLPYRQRIAVLHHEAEHCRKRHMEKRLLLLPLLFAAPRFVRNVCRAQEIEADKFAAANGFGLDLARLLERSREPESMFYPSYEARVHRLTEMSDEKAAA